MEERVTRDESVLFVAWDQTEAAGFIQLYPLWSSWNCRRVWFLSDLYVKDSLRKRGLGSRLVKRVIVYAKDTNAASIMVELPRAQEHLTEFYGKLGFERDEVFDLARYLVSET